jgi:hypothetical protein
VTISGDGGGEDENEVVLRVVKNRENITHVQVFSKNKK